MAGLKKSKRVSWPTHGNLCEVRLFLSDDAPSQSGLGAQDHLQAKATWLLHAAGSVDSNDSLPPGFGAPHKQQPKIDVSKIPLSKWRCPPKVILNPEWLVVAGEESEEVTNENQRQSGVLEAVYPRQSSIPPNPFVTPEVDAAPFDDSCTPIVPLIAIEDEDTIEQSETVTLPYNSASQVQSSTNARTCQLTTQDLRFTLEQLKQQSDELTPIPNEPPPPPPLSSSSAGPAASVEPDVLAAASAAFTAIMRSSEAGSLVDRELLIKILSNPGMLEKLVSEYGPQKQTPAVAQTAAPTSTAPSFRPPLTNAPMSIRSLAPSFRPPLTTAPTVPMPIRSSAPSSSFVFQPGNSFPPPALNPHHPSHLSVAPPVIAPPTMKDASYYKSLIQLHGGEKQETVEQQQQLQQHPVQFSNLGNPLGYHNNMMSNVVDPTAVVGPNQGKVLRPCAYFNTARGCRHGASCLFQHNASPSFPQRIEQQKGAIKRIKLDGGIPGRQ